MAIKQYALSRYYTALLILIVLLLGACSDQPETIKRVGILQFTHRLDQAVDGIKQRLTELGYKEGEQVTYLYRNAEVNKDSLVSHIQAMIVAEVDLIIALTTQSSVVAKKYTSGLDIPVIFSLVSDRSPRTGRACPSSCGRGRCSSASSASPSRMGRHPSGHGWRRGWRSSWRVSRGAPP